jgi:hypothetical protein
VALALLGIFLFARYRTVVTAFVALGFVAVVVSHALSNYGHYAATQIYHSSGVPAALNSAWFTWIPNASLWADSGGMWLGSLALLWHMARGASPNNRWRGP